MNKQIVKNLIVMLLFLTFFITNVIATQPSATKLVFVWNPYAMLVLLLSLFVLGGLFDRKRLFWIVVISNFLILVFSNILFVLSIISFSFFPSTDLVSFLFCVLLIPLVFLFFFLIPAVPAFLGSRVRGYIRTGRYGKVLVGVLIIISLATNYFALHTEIRDAGYGVGGESGFSGVVPITHNLSSGGEGVIIMQNRLDQNVSVDNINLTLPPFMDECDISSILPISLEPNDEKRIDLTCNFRENLVGVYYRVDIKIIYTENITQREYESSGVIWGVID